MKTWLCTTLTSFFGPTQGAARLYAYLLKQGYDVSLKDYNQDAYFTLLSPEYLELAYEKLTSVIEGLRRNRLLREDVGSILMSSSNRAVKDLLLNGILSASSWHSLADSPGFIKNPLYKILGSKIKEDNVVYAMLLEKDNVIAEVEKALEIMDKRFFGLPREEFVTNYRTLLCGKALIDAIYFPAQLDFGLGFSGTAYMPLAGDVCRAVDDEKYNFLIPYFRNEVMPSFREEQPELVGISITHGTEFIPALTLANMIKKESPDTHICLGGCGLTESSHRLSLNPPLWEFFDSMILGPGEYAFSRLIEQLETGNDISEVPDIIYRENGTIKRSDRHYEFDINDACTPEYVSVRPRPILPLETSSGCYWGKCIFCYYPKEGTADMNTEYGKKRVRDMELVLGDMDRLKEKYDPVYIGITDSSLHPKRIEQIAEHNHERDSIIRFSAFVRFEKEFTSFSFCRKLADGGFLGGQAGLESGSERVNAIINKGTEMADIKEIIRNFHKTGILLHIYSMVGLPGEKIEDSRMTRDFLKHRRGMIPLGWQVYPLGITELGPLAERAADFGLEVTPMPDEYLVQGTQYTLKDGLSQTESMAMAISIAEELKKYMNPVSRFMDVESHKLFLMAMKSREVSSGNTG